MKTRKIISWVIGLICIFLGVLTPMNFILFTGIGIGLIFLTIIPMKSIKIRK